MQCFWMKATPSFANVGAATVPSAAWTRGGAEGLTSALTRKTASAAEETSRRVFRGGINHTSWGAAVGGESGGRLAAGGRRRGCVGGARSALLELLAQRGRKRQRKNGTSGSPSSRGKPHAYR